MQGVGAHAGEEGTREVVVVAQCRVSVWARHKRTVSMHEGDYMTVSEP
jgi:hypothetical protein